MSQLSPYVHTCTEHPNLICPACRFAEGQQHTWERYETRDEHGNSLCLPCAAKQYIEDDSNWIRLTDEDIAVVTFDVIRKAKHVIGVEMPVPKGIELVDSVTLNSSTGGIVRDFSTADGTPDRGVELIRDILTQAKNHGHKRAILIPDAAYQFAVSIGVYVDAQPKPTRKGQRALPAASGQSPAAGGITSLRGTE